MCKRQERAHKNDNKMEHSLTRVVTIAVVNRLWLLKNSVCQSYSQDRPVQRERNRLLGEALPAALPS
jgi:hypothetical protein